MTEKDPQQQELDRMQALFRLLEAASPEIIAVLRQVEQRLTFIAEERNPEDPAAENEQLWKLLGCAVFFHARGMKPIAVQTDPDATPYFGEQN